MNKLEINKSKSVKELEAKFHWETESSGQGSVDDAEDAIYFVEKMFRGTNHEKDVHLTLNMETNNPRSNALVIAATEFVAKIRSVRVSYKLPTRWHNQAQEHLSAARIEVKAKLLELEILSPDDTVISPDRVMWQEVPNPPRTKDQIIKACLWFGLVGLGVLLLIFS